MSHLFIAGRVARGLASLLFAAGALGAAAGCSYDVNGATGSGGGAPETTSAGKGEDACVNWVDGPAPAGRYTVLDPGTGVANDGSGLVKDTKTGLEWARNYYGGIPHGVTQAAADSYCESKGGRLPTEGEALDIAGVGYDDCAWPSGWYTWTSTSAGPGLAWGVGDDGNVDANGIGNDYYGLALCVR